MSSTYWLRDIDKSRPAVIRHHSGCSSYRRLAGDIISGSNHMPNFSPRSFIFFTRGESPPRSFSSFTNQSPREERSSFRLPNHPSSITSISIPQSDASFAMASSFSSSKAKYVASQLFTRIGRSRSAHSPRQRFFLYSLWYVRDIFPRPSPDITRTASGVTNSSPTLSFQSNPSGEMPAISLTKPKASVSQVISKFPEYTSEIPNAIPCSSVVSEVTRAAKGLWWWLDAPRLLETDTEPWQSGVLSACLSLPHVPQRWRSCASGSTVVKSTEALYARRICASAFVLLRITVRRQIAGRSRITE